MIASTRDGERDDRQRRRRGRARRARAAAGRCPAGRRPARRPGRPSRRSARASVPARPARSSGRERQPAPDASRQVDSASRSAGALVASSAATLVMRRVRRSSYDVLAFAFGLGLLVRGDQVGVARHGGQQLARGCRARPPGRARGRPPRRRARSWPAGRRRPGSTRRRRGRAATARMRRLDPRVDRAGRVVEDQQPRPAGQRAGQGEPLALPAGQRGAALADRRCPARRAAAPTNAVGLGQAQRRPAPRRRRRRSGPSATLPRTVSSKTNGTCGTSATVAGERGRGQLAAASTPSSATVPAAGSTRRAASEAIVDLPEPVGADQGDGPPGRDRERDVVQHRRAAVVREVDPRRSAASAGPVAGQRRPRRRRMSPVGGEHRLRPAPSRRRCAAARRAPSRSPGPGRPAR